MGGGFSRPTPPIPGTDLAGDVVACGPGATRFPVGTRVFGQVESWNLWKNGGTFAQFACIHQDRIARLPDHCQYAEGAAVATSGQIALGSLDLSSLGPNARMLINGAGGAVGSLAVQMARTTGAHITAVDLEPKRALLMERGAHQFLDGQSVDWTQCGQTWNHVFDILGNRPLRAIRQAIDPEGSYVLIGHDHFGREGRPWLGSIPKVFSMACRAPFTKPRLRISPVTYTEPLLEILARFLEQGQLRPIVEAPLPLSALPEAMEKLIQGSTLGRQIFNPQQ
jgi:NADPH:quinone reductase-like Zn-dependent oxidoreductase